MRPAPMRIPAARQTEGPAEGAETVSTASTGGRAGWSVACRMVASPPPTCTGVTTRGRNPSASARSSYRPGST